MSRFHKCNTPYKAPSIHCPWSGPWDSASFVIVLPWRGEPSKTEICGHAPPVSGGLSTSSYTVRYWRLLAATAKCPRDFTSVVIALILLPLRFSSLCSLVILALFLVTHFHRTPFPRAFSRLSKTLFLFPDPFLYSASRHFARSTLRLCVLSLLFSTSIASYVPFQHSDAPICSTFAEHYYSASVFN